MYLNRFLQTMLFFIFLITASHADGTNANTTVSSQSLLTFGDTLDKQKQILSNIDTYVVDDIINFSVDTIGSNLIKTIPGAQQAVLRFKVTNRGNNTQDFHLRALHASTSSSFQTNNTKVYVDTDNNGIYNAKIDTMQFIDELGVDSEMIIFIVSDIPAKGLRSDDTAIYDLEVRVARGGEKNIKGDIIIKDNSQDFDDAAVRQTVFADNAGSLKEDIKYDGRHSSRHGYLIYLSSMIMSQTTCVIQDPLNHTSNPKRIPGATIRHCYSVKNDGNKDSFIATITDSVDTSSFNLLELESQNIRLYDGHEKFNCMTADKLPTTPNKGSIDHQTGKIRILFNGVPAQSIKSAYFDLKLH